MFQIILHLVAASVLPFSPQSTDGALEKPPILDQVEVQIHSQAEYDLLTRLVNDVDDHHPVQMTGHATCYLTDAEQAILQQRGFVFDVQIEDLSSFYAERARLDSGRNAVGSMGGFRTLAEVEQEMDRIAATWPGIASSKFSIGTSVQGRNIWAMRISTTPSAHDPSKPVAWFDAVHHAREPMAGESVLAYADWLCSNYGLDEDVDRVIETRNVLVIPIVNPDGYEYNRQTNPNGGGMWRKNRRNNGSNYGVDLNRNYSYEWGSQWNGSSGSTGSETYRGPSAFSEPETQAIRDLLAVQTPGMSVSAHTYSNLWIYPWGYSTVYTSENAAFREFSERQTEHNGWVYGTAWEVLYTANGVNDDYHYGVHGTYAFTPEIGSSSDGFWPNPSRIPALTADALPTYQMVSEWTGAWAEVSNLTWSEVSGNGDAYPDAGETWQLQPVVHNAGSQTLIGNALLVSNEPLINVTGGSSSMNIGQLNDSTLSAFTVTFDAATTSGHYQLDMQFDYEGYVNTTPVDILVGRPRTLLHDDMEVGGFGWSVSNSTNWSWERADPQQTSTGGQTSQSGNDNPNGSGVNCWVTGAAAGSSAGTNDVDGTTILTSPLFHASNFESLTLEYARWFANLPGNATDDEFVAEISNNGGSTWTELEATPNANNWTTVSFRLEDYIVPTNSMKLRFTVSDNPNNDITEGMLDDVKLYTVSSLPTLGLLGEASIGSSVRLHFDGPASKSWTLVYSMSKNNGQTIPGIDGLFYLNNYKILQSGVVGANGTASWQTTIPNDPNLVGKTVHLQSVFDYGGAVAAFSNLLSLEIL
ncbi:MAG: zinc carboxypeptidase [Planctomycetes bacterium]|nr:zinc carboxypeptidase [Planctomycetota bacterium]